MEFARRWQWPLIMAAAAWPAILLRFHVISAPHLVETVLYGLAIAAAGFPVYRLWKRLTGGNLGTPAVQT